MSTEQCKSCPATFVWGLTEKRRAIPLDAERDADGKWSPVEDPKGNIEPTGAQTWGRNGGLVPVVRALRKDEIAQVSMAPRWRSHFATCPKAAEHSRGRRRPGRGTTGRGSVVERRG